MTSDYKNADEILAIVKGFEDCSIGKDSFSHRSHLTVGAVYLQTLMPEEAFEKMRAGLLRFLNHHQIDTSIYSDDITRRWLNEIQKVIDEMTLPGSLLETTNVVVARLAEKNLGDQAEKGKRGNGEQGKERGGKRGKGK